MALTPDFDSYPTDSTIASVVSHRSWVDVAWSDGKVSGFHHVWLRDNCPCPECVHQGTKEQTFEIVDLPTDVRMSAVSVAVSNRGRSVMMTWDGPQMHVSEFDGGWLRRHAYDDESRRARRTTTVTWDATTLIEPPTFDGAEVMVDDDALYEWLTALSTYGVSRVRNVPAEPDAIGELVARIGIVRDTNFGLLWDVKREPNPISNANTSLPLPPHVDLPTREYQPGLQFLHCMVNEAEGGQNILVDGFRIAEILRDEHPSEYAILTTVPFEWANRSTTSDYRWTSPMIVADIDGSLKEMRVGNWLRAPLDVPFDMVESCYAAYRRLFELTYRTDLQLRFRLETGEVMAFDNRRALHARGEFSDVDTTGVNGPGAPSGRRFLRGCYSERDELRSRMRMIERARRERLSGEE